MPPISSNTQPSIVIPSTPTANLRQNGATFSYKEANNDGFHVPTMVDFTRHASTCIEIQRGYVETDGSPLHHALGGPSKDIVNHFVSRLKSPRFSMKIIVFSIKPHLQGLAAQIFLRIHRSAAGSLRNKERRDTATGHT